METPRPSSRIADAEGFAAGRSRTAAELATVSRTGVSRRGASQPPTRETEMTHRRIRRGPIFLLIASALAFAPASAHPQAVEDTMEYEIERKTLEPRPVLGVRGPTTLDDVPSAIAERTRAVWQHMQGIGVQPAGPPFTRYHQAKSDGEVDLEVGFPVPEPLEGEGEVESARLPGGEVIVTVHHGPYDGLTRAGAALDRWLEENDREARGPNWEVYRVNAGTVDDPSEYETDVFKPVR